MASRVSDVSKLFDTEKILQELDFNGDDDEVELRRDKAAMFVESYRFRILMSRLCHELIDICCKRDNYMVSVRNKNRPPDQQGLTNVERHVLLKFREWKLQCEQRMRRLQQEYTQDQLALFYVMDDVEFEARRNNRTLQAQLALIMGEAREETPEDEE